MYIYIYINNTLKNGINPLYINIYKQIHITNVYIYIYINYIYHYIYKNEYKI